MTNLEAAHRQTAKLQAPLLIIPAAGFGRRVGRPPAKELLLRPDTGEPLIEAPLRWAQERGWPALVITRHEKHSLIEYLENRPSAPPRIVCIDRSDDWQSTILQAEEAWAERNLVVLPDTEFSPLLALDDLGSLLETKDVVVGLHSVKDPQNWGHFWPLEPGAQQPPEPFEEETSSAFFYVAEKPSAPARADQAWGIFGFHQKFGRPLLAAQWESYTQKKAIRVEGRLGRIPLTHFADLAR